MTTEVLDLWGNVVPPSVPHSTTSAASADAIAPTTSEMRAKVLMFISLYGPVSDEQIQNALGLSGDTERPRRRELELAGSIYCADENGRSSSGRKAKRWAVVGKRAK